MSRQRTFNRPLSPVKPCVKGSRLDVDVSCPFAQRASFASVSDKPSVPRVVRLLPLRRPPNVSGLIVSVVVNAINAVLGRRFLPNVFKKRREAANPLRVYTNTSSAVVLVRLVVWVQAAVFKVFPGSIFRRASALSVNGPCLDTLKALPATTGFRASGFQVVSRNGLNRPALTPAFPVRVGFPFWIWLKNSEPMKYISDPNRTHHPPIISEEAA